MKRALTIVFAFIMSCTMIFAFFGCKETEKNKFEGKWTAKVDITKLLTRQFDNTPQFFEFFEISDCYIFVDFEFNEDGTYSAVCDRNASEQSLENAKKDFEAGIEKTLLASAKEMGLDMTLDEILVNQNATMEELVSDCIDSDAISIAYQFLEQEGDFELESGKLYRFSNFENKIDKDVYETYEFVGDDKIKITGIVGEKNYADQKELVQSMYPIVLERK